MYHTNNKQKCDRDLDFEKGLGNLFTQLQVCSTLIHTITLPNDVLELLLRLWREPCDIM